MAHEVAHVGARVGGEVEELVGRDAGPRVHRDVADGVAAALAGREAGVGDLADELGHLHQRDVVDLDVLPRRDVRLVQRGVLLRDVSEHLQLLRGDPAHGQLDAAHLHVGLALAVDALLEAEADELVLRGLAVEELLRLRVEVVELLGDDRDDVARDLVELRALQRAAPTDLRRGGGIHGTECIESRPRSMCFCRPGWCTKTA